MIKPRGPLEPHELSAGETWEQEAKFYRSELSKLVDCSDCYSAKEIIDRLKAASARAEKVAADLASANAYIEHLNSEET